MRLGTSAPGLRLRLRHHFLDDPLLGDAYLRLRAGYAAQTPGAGTRITIDGFPRSGNSYAWFAYQLDNGATGLSGHTHSSRALIRSCRLGIPAVLLLREPRGCIASYIQHQDGAPFAAVCSAYLRFHRRLLPVAERLVIAPFELFIEDFGLVADEVNRRFGSDFERYERSDRNEAEVFRRIELSFPREEEEGLLESRVARPSTARLPSEAILDNLSPDDRRALGQATALWRDLRSRQNVIGDGSG